MKNTVLALLLLFNVAFAQQRDFQYYYSQAREALKEGNYQQYHELITNAGKLHPYHQGILYHRGIAAALINQPEEAIRFLQQAVQINASYDLSIPELSSLTKLDGFQTLLKFQQEIKTPILNSDTAFVIKDRSLHAETIAQGEKKGIFYLSSVHKRKVIKINADGSQQDFITEAQDGLTSVLGLKVDSKNNFLWVCSSPMPEMTKFDTTNKSSVIKYDLKTKKALQIFSTKKESVFGDLILNTKGEAFVSDSKNNIIYKASEKTNELEVFFTSPEFWNIQGITFSPDEKYLFIADYIKGIYRLDVSTKTLIQLQKNIQTSLKSIDGLHWHNHSLVAIQNGVSPMKVTEYILNSTFDSVIDYQIVDRAHPAFNEPTNGCIVNNVLYYVANSQWGGYDEQHKPKPDSQLQDIVILKYNLSK